jgi:hypothetical protein
VKVGDMIECVESGSASLTVGQSYRVVEFGDPIFITVINDDGDRVQYFRGRFRIPSEIR